MKMLGRNELNSKNYEQSYQYYQACIDAIPKAFDCTLDWAWGLVVEGNDLQQQGKTEEALATYTKAEEKAQELLQFLSPTDSKAVYLFLMGNIKFYMANYPAAIDAFQSALDADAVANGNTNSSWVECYTWLSWSYYYNGQISKAEEEYEVALAIDPNNASVKVLGNFLKNSK